MKANSPFRYVAETNTLLQSNSHKADINYSPYTALDVHHNQKCFK
jgi:hypothetical protein